MKIRSKNKNRITSSKTEIKDKIKGSKIKNNPRSSTILIKINITAEMDKTNNKCKDSNNKVLLIGINFRVKL